MSRKAPQTVPDALTSELGLETSQGCPHRPAPPRGPAPSLPQPSLWLPACFCLPFLATLETLVCFHCPPCSLAPSSGWPRAPSLQRPPPGFLERSLLSLFLAAWGSLSLRAVFSSWGLLCSCDVQAPHCRSFSLHVAPAPGRTRFGRRGVRAEPLRFTGSGALRHVGSSQTEDRTRASWWLNPAIGPRRPRLPSSHPLTQRIPSLVLEALASWTPSPQSSCPSGCSSSSLGRVFPVS